MTDPETATEIVPDTETEAETETEIAPRSAATLTHDATREQIAKTFAHFIQMLEDGYLHAELTEKLRDLNADMNDHAASFAGKARGRITLNLNFVLDKGVFEITADVKVKKPEAKRDRTIAWSTPENHFSPENPRQGALFGPRAV